MLNGRTVNDSGVVLWYKDGLLHREDGPALIAENGNKAWYKDGLLHREDGPAWQYASGYKDYFIHGKQLTEKEFNERMGVK